MATHRKSHDGLMKKTLAAGAIAGAAVGFGALAAAPLASADTNDNTGWWLGSGNANGNNTIYRADGQRQRQSIRQLQRQHPEQPAERPQPGDRRHGGTGQHHVPVTSPVTSNAQTSALNGGALAVPVNAGTTTATSVPIGGALALPIGVGANTQNTGGQIPIPINVPVNTTTGGIAIPVVPILSNTNPGGPTVNNNTGGPTSATGGEISGDTTAGNSGDAEATNVQVSGASASST